MLNLVIDDAKLFKRMIDAVSALVDEGEFLVDDQGMHFRAADQGMIAMVDLSIPRKAFKEYALDGTVKLGIDIDGLSRVLARARSNDSLVLGLSDDKASLKVSLQGSATRTFSLSLLDISASALPVPNIDFDANIVVDADILQDGFRDAKLFNVFVKLKAEGNVFELLTRGSSGNFDFKLKEGDSALVSIQVKNPAQASFPLDYLEDALKQAYKDSKIELSFKNSNPVRIKYNINDASLVYYIAPRAEVD